MPSMPLLIPFAAPRAAPWDELSALRLPHLQALLARWPLARRDEGDELSLSPPHERALALALGWHGADGCLPWAARAAAADGIDIGDLAWGQITPAHWHLGTDQVSLIDPAGLMLDEAASRTLFTAVQDLFTSAGWLLAWGAPLRWYAAHESLADLPTAALDRVIGRNVDRWLGQAPALRTLRRMQAEVQMLLYNHPLNDQRQSRGLLPVNSFWLSGCGPAQAQASPAPTVDERLRGPALAGDWPGWLRGWETLDEGPLQALLRSTDPGSAAAPALVLCGERGWARFEPGPAGLLDGLLQRLRRRPDPRSLLETL
jgi:hypothetical protein